MSTIVYHPHQQRGFADHGWLKSHHSFSFGNFYNPERARFGLLRVINDDVIAPSKGFDTHPHDNMEIVSIPLSGALEHKDSEGNHHVIRAGEVQIMSAGTGIQHSEFNYSSTDLSHFLQIWIFPKVRDIPPSYGQKAFSILEDSPTLLLSPEAEGGSLKINQDAWLYLFKASKKTSVKLSPHSNSHGFYVLQ